MENITTQGNQVALDASRHYLIVGSIMIFILSLFGLFGNVFICLFINSQNPRRVVSIMLQSVATYDTISILLMFPAAVAIFLFAVDVPNAYLMNVISGKEGNFYRYIWRVPKFCSNIFLFAVAVERIFCILKPQSVKIYFTHKRGKVFAIITSMVVPATLLPVALFSYFKGQSDVDIRSTLILLRTITFVFYFYIPVFGIIICSGMLVALLLKESRRRKLRLYNSHHSRHHSYERQTTVLVVFVTSVFVMCVTPYNLCLTFEDIYEGFTNMILNTHTRVIFIILETINYSINTFIFYFGSSRFKIFCKQNLCSRRVEPESGTSRDDGITYVLPLQIDRVEMHTFVGSHEAPVFNTCSYLKSTNKNLAVKSRQSASGGQHTEAVSSWLCNTRMETLSETHSPRPGSVTMTGIATTTV